MKYIAPPLSGVFPFCRVMLVMLIDFAVTLNILVFPFASIICPLPLIVIFLFINTPSVIVSNLLYIKLDSRLMTEFSSASFINCCNESKIPYLISIVFFAYSQFIACAVIFPVSELPLSLQVTSLSNVVWFFLSVALFA